MVADNRRIIASMNNTQNIMVKKFLSRILQIVFFDSSFISFLSDRLWILYPPCFLDPVARILDFVWKCFEDAKSPNKDSSRSLKSQLTGWWSSNRCTFSRWIDLIWFRTLTPSQNLGRNRSIRSQNPISNGILTCVKLMFVWRGWLLENLYHELS